MELALTNSSMQLYIIKTMIIIAIRATCYIFCCRNRNWDIVILISLLFFFSFFFLSFLFFFFFIIHSQAAFVNCLYVAKFTIVHSKPLIKFPLLLLSLLLLLLLLLLLSISLLLFFLLLFNGNVKKR